KLAPALEAALRKTPEVRTLHSVSGTFDMVAVVMADTVDEMDRLIDQIGALDGGERTTTAIILSTRIDRGAVCLTRNGEIAVEGVSGSVAPALASRPHPLQPGAGGFVHGRHDMALRLWWFATPAERVEHDRCLVVIG